MLPLFLSRPIHFIIYFRLRYGTEPVFILLDIFSQRLIEVARTSAELVSLLMVLSGGGSGVNDGRRVRPRLY